MTMNNLCVLLILIFLLFPVLSLDAAEIVNVSSSQTGQHVVVEYDLVSDAPVMVNVDIAVQGISCAQDQLSLEGDVRKFVQPGKMRKFIWNAKRDFPEWPNLEVTLKSKAAH
jgi:hypothetical protein